MNPLEWFYYGLLTLTGCLLLYSLIPGQWIMLGAMLLLAGTLLVGAVLATPYIVESF